MMLDRTNLKRIWSRYLSYVLVGVVGAVVAALVLVPWVQSKPSYASQPEAAPVAAAGPGIQSPAAALMGTSTIADIAEEVGKAVVSIDTVTMVKRSSPFTGDPTFDEFFNQFFGRRFPDKPVPKPGKGSGFIISPDGYVLTNQHVIDKADEITVTTLDGKKHKAEVVGSDKLYDIALLKIAAKGVLPTVRLGDSSKIRTGEWAIAIGNPYGLEHTVTVGIISATKRSIEEVNDTQLIQTDAAINPGNSGGPLIDIQGNVIGINTAIVPYAQGIGFAIPINAAKEIMEDLKKNHKVSRPWLGIYYQEIDEAMKEKFKLPDMDGVIVAYVVEDSPAEKAKLRQGDVIREINGKKITKDNPSLLEDEVRKSKVGESVVLLVWRNGKTQYTTVKVGEMPAA